MSDRKRIVVSSILVMVGGMFCTAVVTIAILYQTAIEETRKHLVEVASGQAHLLEAVAKHDAQNNAGSHPTGSVLTDTTSIIVDAHKHDSAFGETGELVMARRQGNQIVFLYPYRHGDGGDPEPVPWSSELAEPMRRALSGQEGALVGRDYRGERVLAAYFPVPTLHLGVVAKSDLVEVRAPFVMATTIAGGVTIVLVLIGVGMTLRITDPLVQKLQESEHRLRLTLDAVSDGGWDWNTVTEEVRYGDQWIDSLGYPRDDVPPNVSFWESIVHPEDRARRRQALNDHIEGRSDHYQCEYRLRTASGAYRWTLSRGRVVARDHERQPVRIMGTDTDITERKQAETELRESNATMVDALQREKHAVIGLESAMDELRRGKTDLLRSNDVRGEQARAMGLLFDLSRSLAAAESLEDIVANATTATAALMNSRRVSIMLPDASGQDLYVASATGIDDEIIANILVPVGDAIAGEVFATGKPIVCNSPAELTTGIGRYETDFFASVPLASRALAVANKVVGVLNVTERHDHQPFETHEIEYLDLVCNITASAVERFQAGRERENAHAAIVIGLAKLAEHRDSDTGKHLERVTQFGLLLARELRKSSKYETTIDDAFLEYLAKATPLHDIGKVSVPDAILLKAGPLTDDEFALMKRHTQVGAAALQTVMDEAPEADFLVMARDIAYGHHEWYDGSGYPQGSRDDEIPLAARIVAVADVYDALTTKRPYKESFPHERAVEIIRASSRSHFDPDVVDVFLRLRREFAELAADLQDDARVSWGQSAFSC